MCNLYANENKRDQDLIHISRRAQTYIRRPYVTTATRSNGVVKSWRQELRVHC